MQTTRSFKRFTVLTVVMCAGCVSTHELPLEMYEDSIVLLDPNTGDKENWEHRRLRKADTQYRWVNSSLGPTVQAVGHGSASILFRIFNEIEPACGTLEWQWYVERPQPTSDLRTKGMDDVAASIFVMFGDPGIFRDELVPTLRYVWANKHHHKGEVIVGPYQKKHLRTIIRRVGQSVDGALVTERANLIKDYTKAFGKEPKNGIHGIAIFTDNDDTEEPIIAHYGRIVLLCNT